MCSIFVTPSCQRKFFHATNYGIAVYRNVATHTHNVAILAMLCNMNKEMLLTTHVVMCVAGDHRCRSYIDLIV